MESKSACDDSITDSHHETRAPHTCPCARDDDCSNPSRLDRATSLTARVFVTAIMLLSDTALCATGALPHRRRQRRAPCVCAAASEPLLLRTARGEEVERPPVWLMRQAGRYMKAFRAYSDKYPFRVRSETPEIAIELSLQPWRAFKPDGVIMFSDILTPLPALGIEFDVVKGKGPIIPDAVRSWEQVKGLRPMEDPSVSLPFIAPILRTLRQEVGPQATVLGFVGTPWTLAAYSVEGGAEKDCKATKHMMFHQPQLLHALLGHLADALAVYVCHQIDCGAQVIQLFDSWAHHLSPAQFSEFSLPYAERLMAAVRAKHPATPLIFHANGSAGKEALMATSTADVLGWDWSTDMAVARQQCSPGRVLQGNVDPQVLFGPQEAITAAVAACMASTGRKHILNVGHGVPQGTPEENVAFFVDAARNTAYPARKAAPAGR